MYLRVVMADINKELINAVIQAESAWRPEAVSPKSAAGLMQLREIAWRDVQQNYPELKQYEYSKWKFKPIMNKKFGTAYLNLLNKRLGDKATLENLLGAYNYGMGNMKKINYEYDRLPAETKNYITKIKGILKK